MTTIVGTGYWAGQGEQYKAHFFQLWYENNIRNVPGLCDSQVHVVNAASKVLPLSMYGTWHNMSHNLRHIDAMISNPITDEPVCGWSAAFLYLCMVAYHSNADLLFVEQDCLSFGRWFDVIQAEVSQRNPDMIVGKPAGMSLEQSIVWVRKGYCLEFIRQYLSIPQPDANANARHTFILPEDKFFKIKSSNPRIIDLSFGYGRRRPESFKEETFYIQQPTAKDISSLVSCGRLSGAWSDVVKDWKAT
jgi:hypothetical protein